MNTSETTHARRFADSIGMIRVLLISIVLLCTVVTAPAMPGVLMLVPVLSGAFLALIVHALLGWLEHTLVLLSRIADGADQAATRDSLRL